MDFPVVVLPIALKEELKPYLAQERMGLRYIDEAGFKQRGLKVIQDLFSNMSTEDKARSLFLLRECARTSCVLPAQVKDLGGPVPVLAVTPDSVEDFKNFASDCMKQGLAFPAFEMNEKFLSETILQIYKTIIELAYRGPIFLCSRNAADQAHKTAGLLNTVPNDAIVLNDFTLQGQEAPAFAKALETLRERNWFRVRILPQSAPWMHIGFEF